jgi:hypothetical protein
VNASIHEMEESEVQKGLLKRRVTAVRELQDCVSDIRKIPGHERFLLTPMPVELQKQGEKGPLVVVNITEN